MSSFQTVFSQVLILFLLLLTGFFARSLKVFSHDSIKGMTALIIKISLPAMIIHSMAVQEYTPELIHQSLFMLLASCLMYGAMILLAIPLGYIFKAPAQDRGIYRFVLVFSNVAFMGFPVISAVFGKEALFYAAVFNLPFNLLAFTVGIIMITRGTKQSNQESPEANKNFQLQLKDLLSPVVLSILLGYCIFLFQWKLPDALISFLDLSGSITTPLSMIIIGGMLAGAPIRSVFGDWRLYVLSLFRLIIWPLAVWFILRIFFKDPLMSAIPAIISAMPAAANTALLAAEYGANEMLGSRAVFISTLFSVVSIPFIAFVIGAGA